VESEVKDRSKNYISMPFRQKTLEGVKQGHVRGENYWSDVHK
jgi:hypothetical protein